LANAQPLEGRAVAVIGGATAGAEVAFGLAEQGATVVVFEQNPRPYGKIEDGLPRWHVGLRQKEYDTIDGKLDHSRVEFVPLTKIGRDLSFGEIVGDWGFHAIVLANGAWRDRPFPVEGADRYVGRGLVYQNPFVIAFNHAEERDYQGPRYPFLDNAQVVGGGLASIDVVKILMLKTTCAALAERGIEADLIELEVKGLPKVLARHDLRFADLGIRGATLFHWGPVAMMPIVDIPPDADPPRRQKALAARERLIGKAVDKYCFRVEACAVPDAILEEQGRVSGLRLRRTRAEANDTIVRLDETFERRGAYVISSIGSIPEPIEGIEMEGELYVFDDRDAGQIAHFPNVFAAGNVATGRGNLVASRRHGSFIAERVAEAFLGLGPEGHDGEEEMLLVEGRRDAQNPAVRAHVVAQEPLDAAGLAALRERIRKRQRAVGYEGDYRAWMQRVRPADPSR